MIPGLRSEPRRLLRGQDAESKVHRRLHGRLEGGSIEMGGVLRHHAQVLMQRAGQADLRQAQRAFLQEPDIPFQPLDHGGARQRDVDMRVVAGVRA
jgi:hypothetical protein